MRSKHWKIASFQSSNSNKWWKIGNNALHGKENENANSYQFHNNNIFVTTVLFLLASSINGDSLDETASVRLNRSKSAEFYSQVTGCTNVEIREFLRSLVLSRDGVMLVWASMRSSFITVKQSTWNISTQINVLDPKLIRSCVCSQFILSVYFTVFKRCDLDRLLCVFEGLTCWFFFHSCINSMHSLSPIHFNHCFC